MYNKETKDNLTIDIIKGFESHKNFELTKIIVIKKFDLEPEDCERILAYHFPLGFNDVLLNFSSIINKRLSILSKNKLKNLKVSEKIKFLVLKRLEIISEYKISFNEIIKYLMSPRNLLFSNKLLFSISDELWFLSGDKSLDFNFYTKRFILMKIYTKTFITWVKDNSNKKILTNNILDSQLSKVSKIGKYKFIIQNFFQNIRS